MECTEQERGQHQRDYGSEHELNSSEDDAPDEEFLVEGDEEEAAESLKHERTGRKADSIDVVPASQRVDPNGHRDDNAPEGEANREVANGVMRVESEQSQSASDPAQMLASAL